MKHLDLFSGIGGFALAARWAGFETIGFCEIDKYCQKVLKKNFPDVPIYEDVTKLNGNRFKDIYLITGGFPCQDISVSNTKGKGINGERSGLWSELHRIISEVRPKYALIENVPALTVRGGTKVIADLTSIGYDTEWQIVGADDVGAWHRRKRIWIVAYPRCEYGEKRELCKIKIQEWNPSSFSKRLVHSRSRTKTAARILRNFNGLPYRVDRPNRLKGLGNSICPQVAYEIMKGIYDGNINAD